MFPYKVYYHQDGFEDVCLAQFLIEDDAEGWAIFLNEGCEEKYYYVKEE